MQIPKWLDKLLSDDDENTVSDNDPVTNTEKIPKSSPPPSKKKSSSTDLLTSFTKLPPTTMVAIGLIAVLVVCAIILPKGNRNKDTRESYTVDFTNSVAIGSTEFSLIRVEWSDSYIGDDRGRMGTAAGNTYYNVVVQVRNIGKDSISLYKGDGWKKDPHFVYSLIYEDGYEYFSTVQDGNPYLLENFVDTIIPLQATKRYVTFEVPKSVAEGSEPLAFRVYSASSIVTWTIRPVVEGSEDAELESTKTK